MSSVNGKVALITGGANGIGAEVARRLHEKGAKLVLTDLDEVLLKEVATRLGEDRVLTVVADVRELSRRCRRPPTRASSDSAGSTS